VNQPSPWHELPPRPEARGTPETRAPRDEGRHALVLYDGVCNVCSGSVRFILPRDRKGLFRFASLQSFTAARLLTACGHAPGTLDSLVLIDEGRCYERSEAALRIAGRLPFPWKLAAALRIIPRPLRDAFYNWFAARRYRWFGKKEVCDLPPPGWQERFLE